MLALCEAHQLAAQRIMDPYKNGVKREGARALT